jgi:hypothetical protein
MRNPVEQRGLGRSESELTTEEGDCVPEEREETIDTGRVVERPPIVVTPEPSRD